MNSDEASLIANLYAYGLLAIGTLCLIIGTTVGKLFRKQWDEQSSLKPWNIGFSDFGIVMVAVFLSIWSLSGVIIMAYSLLLDTEIPESHIFLAGSIPMVLGMVIPLTAFYNYYRRHHQQPALKLHLEGIVGTAAEALFLFLAVVPLILVIFEGWDLVLTSLGIEAQPQDLILRIQEQKLSWNFLLIAVIVTLAVPVAEELLFRGFTYRFLKGRMPGWAAMLASSTFFALMHFNLVSFLPLLALGCWLCYSYEKSRNLLVPILVHALFNGNTLIQLSLNKFNF